MADATRTVAWRQASIETARAVVVTCNRDDTAVLATLTVRELNQSQHVEHDDIVVSIADSAPDSGSHSLPNS